MSTRRSSSLVYGKPAISRVHCSRCKEETLHHFRRCNHCGKEQKATTSWEEQFAVSRAITRGGPKKRPLSQREASMRLKHHSWLVRLGKVPA